MTAATVVYSSDELREICERLQNGYISKLIADEKMPRKDYLAALQYIKRAMVDADQCIGYAITHGLFGLVVPVSEPGGKVTS